MDRTEDEDNASEDDRPVRTPAETIGRCPVGGRLYVRTPAETIGAPLAITDADRQTADSHTFTLGGSDMASFDINAGNGQLMTKPDMMLDYEKRQSYTVVVTVDDGSGQSNATDSITVTIRVKDLDEKPVLMVRTGPAINRAPTFPAATAARNVAEDTAAGADIGAPVEARDDGALTYTLRGANAASFTIVATTGQLRAKFALDYETKNSYTVTVRATDGEGATDEITVTINVTNVDEDGTVTLSSANPRVGTALTARLTDRDGVAAGSVTWQWASSNAMNGAYTNIPGAMSDSYMPVAGDEDDYLRATASYTDGYGADTAHGTTANAVVATGAPTTGTGSVVGDTYDVNDDGVIDLEEVEQALYDHFFGEGDEAISQEEVEDVLYLHFFPS